MSGVRLVVPSFQSRRFFFAIPGEIRQRRHKAAVSAAGTLAEGLDDAE